VGGLGKDSTQADERWPLWRSLFRGAVRESLAAANSVARIGLQETRAWERPIQYVVDDNEGNAGVVEFNADRRSSRCERANRDIVSGGAETVGDEGIESRSRGN
jgi:hypothetical protein